ncbi:carbon-nitrogen hydrolase family protein [Agreia pratensis]|uniref:Predicted amidohydrolase n=1 Tax=Agreia pratensis TaxID=150121 RepID=A0A1X7K1E2_9MICO|nr:carbon-nitrogen hydrolase family protein [Agreia pratensis]SMG34506.1 Predicted amidohydrolase [Agreia pratensis]
MISPSQQVSAAGDGLGVAVAQFAPGADTAENLATITRLAERAVSRGASLVVFPEYSSYFSEPFGEGFLDNAEPIDGEFVTRLADVSHRLQIHIVAGMIETAARHDRFSNTVVAVSPQGAVVAAYRKLHLYDAFGSRESDFVEPGSIAAPETFEVGDFTVGLQTCYDIRFPEMTRRLVDAGADLVLVPAEWVRGVLKEHHWRTLVTARALENTIYVAAADHTPPVGVGASLVVDPMGVAVASLAENEDVAVAWITRTRVDDVRLVNPALALRRFGIHEL